VRGVFEESLAVWSMILQPILHRKTVRGDLLLCDKWQTSAQVCCAAKKSDMNKNKKTLKT